MSRKLLLRRLRGQRGYSLIEMLVVLVIMGTVISALTAIIVNASNAELGMNNRFRAQQSARLALDKIRREVHCASSVTLGAAGSPSGPLAAASITLKLPSGCRAAAGAPSCSGSATLRCVTWYASGGNSRFGLYRKNGETTSGGSKYIDYLTLPNLFNYTTPVAGSRKLPKVNVDFPVNLKPPKTNNSYELKDDILLRNAARA